MSNLNIIMQLEQWLEAYDKIFLLDSSAIEVGEIFVKYVKSKPIKKKILFLSMNEILTKSELDFYTISRKEYDKLHEMYFMYEFSDRFQILVQSGLFASLYNYVYTGVLTVDEVVEALLY